MWVGHRAGNSLTDGPPVRTGSCTRTCLPLSMVSAEKNLCTPSSSFSSPCWSKAVAVLSRGSVLRGLEDCAFGRSKKQIISRSLSLSQDVADRSYHNKSREKRQRTGSSTRTRFPATSPLNNRAARLSAPSANLLALSSGGLLPEPCFCTVNQRGHNSSGPPQRHWANGIK